MITAVDLYQLGYCISLKQTDFDKSVDFLHKDSEMRSYLVNLCKGEIQIDYPTKVHMKKPFLRTDDIVKFTAWHNCYKQ
jgi:hypothetical protein